MAGSDMANRIKELRLERNMTLEEVGKLVGVGKSTVRKWETGMIKTIKADKITALAKALNVSIIYLIDDDYMDKEDAEVIKSLGYLHPKEELPPEINAVNTLLFSYGLQIMKVKDEYFFDEAGQLTKEELNEFLNTITSMVHSAANVLIQKKTKQVRNFLEKK